jgi:dinuclear metal center YbgI/SA1388 family protein
VPSLAEVVACLDERYDPAWAEAWDAVGLVCGDPGADVRRVLLAVDPVAAVVDEAVEWGADLVVTHHPLLLRPVHSVAASTPKGAVVHRLVRAGVALHVIHTNADAADPGVSDALAAALGVVDLRPLQPQPAAAVDKIVTFVPGGSAESLIDALAAAGAGEIGAYRRCAWTTTGTGTFLAGAGANPTIGETGRVEQVPEVRVEMVLPRAARGAVVAALRSAHPYEEPAFDVYELAGGPGPRGLGRIGRLTEPVPFAALVARVARALPATSAGVRAAGDPTRPVSTVAVCGGAGDSLLDAAAASGADAYVTADLRHHPASEALSAAGAPALVDVPHWASEWPWLPVLAREIAGLLGPGDAAGSVAIRVSGRCTDPWTAHRASDEGSHS